MSNTTTLLAVLAGAGAGLYFSAQKKKTTNPKNWHKLRTPAEMRTFLEAKIIAIDAKTLSRPWVAFIAVPDGLAKRFARENPGLLFTSFPRDVGNAFAREFGGSQMSEGNWAIGAVPITGPGTYQKEGRELSLPIDENIIDTFVTYARTGVMPEGATVGSGSGTGTGFGFMP